MNKIADQMASTSPSKYHLFVGAAGSHASPLFSSQFDDGSGNTRVTVPYSYRIASRHYGALKRLRRSTKNRITSGLAVLASLVGIVMLIFMCKAVQNRVARSPLNQRNLAVGGEESDFDVIDLCESTSEEEGDVSEPTAPVRSSDDGQPRAKSARLESGAKQVEKARSRQPYSGKQRKRPVARYPSESPSRQEEQRTSPKGDQPSSRSSKPEARRAHIDIGGAVVTPPLDDSPGPARSPEEVTATYGLLLLHGDVAAAPQDLQESSQQQQQAPSQQGEPSLQGSLVLIQHSPVIWSSRRVSATAGARAARAGPQLQPSPHMLSPRLRAAQEYPGEASDSVSPPQPSGDSSPEPQGETVQVALPRRTPTSAPSSTPAVLPEARPTVREHPFSRLPPQVPSVYGQYFTPESAIAHGEGTMVLYPRACAMAGLLAKDWLGPREAMNLADLAGPFVDYLLRYQRRDVSQSPGYEVVRALGYRFLCFDLLVSALHVLGESPRGQWWDRLVREVPHTSNYAYEDPRKYPLRAFNQELSRELSAALAILKTGRRPSKRTLVRLKRMLFCSAYSPPVFKSPRWEPFRVADREAGGNDDQDEDEEVDDG